MVNRPFEDRICLVTGGTRGIGRAIALHLAREGATVIVTYHSGAEAAEETARLLEKTGARHHLVQSDIADQQAVFALTAFVERTFGRLDSLINNAGRTFDGAFAALDPEEYMTVIDTNLLGTMRLCFAAIPLLVRSRGTIVNLSSLAGVAGKEGQVIYSATKGGVNGLTRMLARVLGAQGVRVNSIAPGFIRTDMVASLAESTYAHVLSSTASGAMGDPEDVAKTVAFLAGGQSSYVNGEVIRIDGGFHR